MQIASIGHHNCSSEHMQYGGVEPFSSICLFSHSAIWFCIVVICILNSVLCMYLLRKKMLVHSLWVWVELWAWLWNKQPLYLENNTGHQVAGSILYNQEWLFVCFCCLRGCLSLASRQVNIAIIARFWWCEGWWSARGVIFCGCFLNVSDNDLLIHRFVFYRLSFSNLLFDEFPILQLSLYCFLVLN